MSIYWADVSHELAFIVPSRGLEEDQQANKSSQLAAANPSACSQSATTVNSSLGSSSNYEEKNYQKGSFPNNNSSEQRSMSSYSDDTISSASHNLSENSSQLRNPSISINNSLTNNGDLNNQRKKGRQALHANIGCDIKILIIWLENSEDEHNLPISKQPVRPASVENCSKPFLSFQIP